MKYIFLLFIIIYFSGCQKALDDLNKSLEESRMNLNSNQNTYSKNQINQQKMPKFNSLAEEVAYKKKLEENGDIERKKEKLEFNNLIDELKQFKEERISFYKKFLVQNYESLDQIDARYKNSANTMNEAKKEYISIKSKALKFWNLNKEWNLSRYIDFSLTPSGSPDYPYNFNESSKLINQELGEYLKSRPFDLYVDLEDYLNVKNYQNYLKEQYNSYQSRVEKKEMQKRLEEEKKQNSIKYEKEKEQRKIKQANEKATIDAERNKVKSACQTWLKKSKEEVNSLGVGDHIVTMYNNKAGIIYKIESVEKNTFLVWDGLMKRYNHFPKTSFIPFSAFDKSPSKYCYE